MFDCLNSIKVPSGYSSNIKRLLNLKEKKFAHVKSHDCHVLMTQLIPVALRGILPANVRATIIKLCAFLNTISQKAIDPSSLSRLQEDVVCWWSPTTHFDRQLSCKSRASEEINVSIGCLFDELHRCWSENVCRWIWAKTAGNEHIIQGINSWAKHKQAQKPKGPTWQLHMRGKLSPHAWHVIDLKQFHLDQSDTSKKIHGHTRACNRHSFAPSHQEPT